MSRPRLAGRRSRLVKAACPRCENPVKGRGRRRASPLHWWPVESIEGFRTEPADEAAPTSAPAAARLAIIDSDSGFVRVLAKRIGAVGWRAQVLGSAPPIEEVQAMRQHAIVIDTAMLGSEAWTYLGRLVLCPRRQAVVVCTGPTSVAQRVRGLRLGADDWVTKPCHPEEVLARVEAALRARQAAAMTAESAGPVVAGELEIRPDMFEAFVGGRSLGLTRSEFELLVLLAASQGRVIPRERIYERVWGYADGSRRPLRGRVRPQAPARSSRLRRPGGATCTRTSASATGSTPMRPRTTTRTHPRALVRSSRRLRVRSSPAAIHGKTAASFQRIASSSTCSTRRERTSCARPSCLTS